MFTVSPRFSSFSFAHRSYFWAEEREEEEIDQQRFDVKYQAYLPQRPRQSLLPLTMMTVMVVVAEVLMTMMMRSLLVALPPRRRRAPSS